LLSSQLQLEGGAEDLFVDSGRRGKVGATTCIIQMVY
jgi:hypothetical protein